MKNKKKIDISALPVLTETLDQAPKTSIPVLTDILESDSSQKETTPQSTIKAPFKPRTPPTSKMVAPQNAKAAPPLKGTLKTTTVARKVPVKQTVALKPIPKSAPIKKVAVSAPTNPVAPQKKPVAKPVPKAMPKPTPKAVSNLAPKAVPKPVTQLSFPNKTPIAKPPKRSGVLLDQASFQELEERLSERVQKEIIGRLTSTLDQYLLQQVSSILEKTLNLLSEEIKTEMQQSLESIVSKAISDELKSLKQRIDKVNKL